MLYYFDVPWRLNSLKVFGDVLMSNNTLRLLFGDSTTLSYSHLVVHGSLIMNAMLLEMVVQNVTAWNAIGMLQPVVADQYIGTYSTSTIDVSTI